MSQPMVLSGLPPGLQQLAVKFWFQKRWKPWTHLFAKKDLRFAPGVSMVDLLPGDIISTRIAFTGVWGLEFSRVVRKLGAKGGLMVDVGANMGYFSLLWASASPGNRVVAVEASPRLHNRLRRNIEVNGFANQIRVVSVAAGKDAGMLPFVLGSEEQSGWGGLVNTSNEPTIQVEVERLEKIIEEPGEIALMKIDIEGADTWAIEGCGNLLRQKRIKELWFEENKQRMATLGIEHEEAMNFLRSCGYEVEAMSSRRKVSVEWRAYPVD